MIGKVEFQVFPLGFPKDFLIVDVVGYSPGSLAAWWFGVVVREAASGCVRVLDERLSVNLGSSDRHV